MLKSLYPDKNLSLHKLAEVTQKDPSNLSKLVTELEGEDLRIVETKEVPRRRGRPYRLIKLGKRGSKILSCFITAASSLHPPKYDPTTIDLCLEVVEDKELDEETRMLYANALHSLFTAIPNIILKEHERLRKTLEKVLQDPPAEGKVEERKRSMIKMALPQLITDETTRSWVINTVYPQALATLESWNKSERILMWVLSMLESIGTRSKDHQEEIRSKIVEIYFEKTLNKMEHLDKELKNSIIELFCRETESARELATNLRRRAKSGNEKEKEKATTLLKKIIQYLAPAQGIITP